MINNTNNIKIFKESLKEVQSINKDLIYNYEYKYYKSIEPDQELNNKYSELARKGYDLFRQDNPDITVSYAGVTSLREIQDRETGNIKGYITETKLSSNANIEKAKEIYQRCLDLFIKKHVKDKKNFMYFFNDQCSYDLKDRVQNEVHKINYLINLEQELQEDEEFKEYFYKIVK